MWRIAAERTVVAVVALVVLLGLKELSLPVDDVVRHEAVGFDWRLPGDVQFTKMRRVHCHITRRRWHCIHTTPSTDIHHEAEKKEPIFFCVHLF